MRESKALAALPICRTKDVIEQFAQETARLQRMADVAFYTCNDRDHSSWLCDQAYAIKSLAEKWESGNWFMPGLLKSMTSGTLADRVIP